MGSSALEHAIKVRKPYTITKQRERWTEEEHNKFLEALKLYGRAWRQIEEHIGSKTAVQIRSHAQKFFTKAVRESETIEIPPPRPKKRPMRPYPRKLGNLPSIQVMEKFPFSEQDNQSPTSVLSSTSDQMNRCTSPVSSVAGSDQGGTLLCEQETVCHSATMPVDDEDESMPQQTSDMELDLGTDDSVPSKVASLVEAPLGSLRLFGKTVIVAEPHKPANFNTEDTEPVIAIDALSLNAVDAEPAISTDVAKQHPARVHEQGINGSVPTLQLGEGSSEWNPWAITMAPAFYLLPSHGTLASSAEAGVVPMPWFWAVSGENQSSAREWSDDGSVQKECSSGDSNSIELTIKNVGDCLFNYHGLDDHGGMPVSLKRSVTSAFRILKPAPKKDLKGFVPYKRCMAEREVMNQKVINSNGGGSRV